MSTIADKKRRYTESVAGIALLAEKYPTHFFHAGAQAQTAENRN